MTRLIIAATATVILFFAAAPAGAFVSVPGAPGGHHDENQMSFPRPGHDGKAFDSNDGRNAGGVNLPTVDDRSYDESLGEGVIGIYSVPPPVTVPEPATMVLFGLGLAGAGLAGRKFLR